MEDKCIPAFTEFVKSQYQKDQERKERQRNRDLRANLETKSSVESKLQVEINKIVRLIDRGHNCISSGRPLGENYNAGHFYSVGSNPAIRFHLLNIWGQSISDNQHKGGKPIEYAQNLEAIYGSGFRKEVESLSKIQLLSLSKEEIRGYIKMTKGIVKRLKQETRAYTNHERLSIRRELNKELGIYEQ